MQPSYILMTPLGCCLCICLRFLPHIHEVRLLIHWCRQLAGATCRACYRSCGLRSSVRTGWPSFLVSLLSSGLEQAVRTTPCWSVGLHRSCYPATQEAKRYCREVTRVLRSLKEKRDMSLNEVKLTVAIEDPIKREQKEFMGVEVPTQSCSPIATKSIALSHGLKGVGSLIMQTFVHLSVSPRQLWVLHDVLCRDTGNCRLPSSWSENAALHGDSFQSACWQHPGHLQTDVGFCTCSAEASDIHEGCYDAALPLQGHRT